MRLLITGGSGYLGRHLAPLAARGCAVAYTYFAGEPLAQTGLTGFRLDIRDGAAVAALAAQWRPHAIIHTAGSNRTPDMAAVIVQGARHVAAAATQVGARLIHLSSDVVLDGAGGPYTESAATQPLHAYGQAKATAETLAQATPNHVIVRTSLIYGLRRMDWSASWMASALQRGETVTLFTNQWRNPISAKTLSAALLELVEHPYTGILHLAGRQALTRAEFGLRLLDYWAVRERDTLRLAPDLSGLYPLDCRLDTTLAGQLLQTPLPGVDEVLAGEGNEPSG